jgi:hypothetical protein
VLRLAAPRLVSPLNNAAIVTLVPSFSWESVAGAQGYRLFFDTELAFPSPDMALESATTVRELTGIAPEILTNGTTYYWRVCALDNSGIRGDYSTPASFDVLVPQPGVPTVSGASPVNTARPAWTWTVPSGSVAIRYQLDGEAGGSWTAVTKETASFTPSVDLDEGSRTLYVQAQNEVGDWSASGQRSIVVDLTAPDPPVVTGTSPTLEKRPAWSWTAPGDAVELRLQLDAQSPEGCNGLRAFRRLVRGQPCLLSPGQGRGR